MDLLGRKPRWCGCVWWAAILSHLSLNVLAIILLSVLDIARGRVLSLWYAACPSLVVLVAFLGRHASVASLNLG